jgi:hypothetical protein
MSPRGGWVGLTVLFDGPNRDVRRRDGHRVDSSAAFAADAAWFSSYQWETPSLGPPVQAH